MQGARRPRWRTSALAIALMLFAAGCGGGSGQTAGDGTCPEGGVAIAFFGPLTGNNSPQLGINVRNGVALAVEQYMAGNPECPVELVQLDSQGDPAQAPALAQQAVQSARIVAVVGPTFSGESNAADPIFDEAGLPTITPSATNPGLSTHDWDIFHRAVATDGQQGPAAATHIAQTLGASRVAVIDDRSEYGLGLADAVRAALGDAVVHNDAIDTAAQDYSSTVNGVSAADVDAIFFGGYYQQGGLLLKQLRDAGVTATFISGDGSRDEQLIAVAGEPAAQGALLTCPCAPNDQLQGGAEFVSAYTEAYGRPGIYAAEGFDVANMLLEAIRQGQTDRASINEWLNTASYDGITKTLMFQPNGEISGGQIYLYEVRGSELAGVGPIG
ncbi:MAG: branched-chain amino acid ABC transporter substrate-binding protein [Egibacteraceae bacterium]